MGLFVGASILSLYEVSVKFFVRIISKSIKFKSRVGTGKGIEELKTEQDMKTNDNILQLTQNSSSTPYENENSKFIIKMQEELAKQAEMLTKLANKISTLENQKANMDHFFPRKKLENLHFSTHTSEFADSVKLDLRSDPDPKIASKIRSRSADFTKSWI